jgi:hypothetical protein
MATAIITLTDSDDGTNVDVSLSFGEAGADNDSNAHHMAIAMLRGAAEAAGGLDDD